MKCQSCEREFTDRSTLMLHLSQTLCKSSDQVVIEEKLDNNYYEKQSNKTLVPIIECTEASLAEGRENFNTVHPQAVPVQSLFVHNEMQSFVTDAAVDVIEFEINRIISDSHLENVITENTSVLEATVDHEGNLTFLDNVQYPSPCGTNENYETETNADNAETNVCIENVHIHEAETDKTVYNRGSSDNGEIPTVRKRKRKESEWAVIIRKKKRNSGKPYITRKKNC